MPFCIAQYVLTPRNTYNSVRRTIQLSIELSMCEGKDQRQFIFYGAYLEHLTRIKAEGARPGSDANQSLPDLVTSV